MSMPTPPNANTMSKRVIKNEKLSAVELKTFMNKHGISEKELSEIFGVTIQAVRLWTSGQRDFSVTNSRIIRMFQKYPQLIGEF